MYPQYLSYINQTPYKTFHMYDMDGCLIDSETAIAKCWSYKLNSLNFNIPLIQKNELIEMLNICDFLNIDHIITVLDKNDFFMHSPENKRDVNIIFYNAVILGSLQKNRQKLLNIFAEKQIIRETIDLSTFEVSNEFNTFIKDASPIPIVHREFLQSIETKDTCTLIVTGANYERTTVELEQFRGDNINFIMFKGSGEVEEFIFHKRPDTRTVYVFTEFPKANQLVWEKGAKRLSTVYPNLYQGSQTTTHRLYEDGFNNLEQFEQFSNSINKMRQLSDAIGQLKIEKYYLKLKEGSDELIFETNTNQNIKY